MRWHGTSSCNSATGKPGHFITQKSTADELRSSRLFSGFERVELPGSIRQDAMKKAGSGNLGFAHNRPSHLAFSVRPTGVIADQGTSLMSERDLV